MARTIAINGTGTASVKPDRISISLTLFALDTDYAKAMQKASQQLESLKKSMGSVGFDSDEIKTTGFNVRTEYETVFNEINQRKNVFKGYNCIHNLKIDFDMDTERLAAVLSAISCASAEPELHIAFTVENSEEIRENLLRAAAENSRKNAEILCDATGVKLGNLISVRYDIDNMSFLSPTSYRMDRNCMLSASADGCSIDINPENIELSENVEFEWEIV